MRKFRIPGRAYLFTGVAAVGVFAHDTPVAAGSSNPALNTLYNFTPADGAGFEFSSLIEASDGNLYGVSALGGFENNGYVYKVSRSTGQMVHLHDFAYSDGSTPRGTLVQGPDGDLYGTTEAGGANRSDYCLGGQTYQRGNCGVAFKVSPAGAFTKLHDFYSAADGYQAGANTGMVLARDGNFYGMAIVEFPTQVTSVFKMKPDGSVSLFYALAADGSQGAYSYTGLVAARDGDLYGTTSTGGAAPYAGGTVFRISLSGEFQLLYTFQGAPTSGTGDGALPWGKLIEGSDGVFYGTTFGGGTTLGPCVVGGCGTIYSVTSAGAESVLHRFTGAANDGEWPQNAGLVQVPGGLLYGVAGGDPYGTIDGAGCYVDNTATPGCGIVYAISTAGDFKQLQTFSKGDGSLGLFPMTSLVAASDHDLYGVTIDGGGWGAGTVYRLLLDAATPVVAISDTSPPGGPPGTPVAIIGEGFTGATQVTFPTGAATSIPFTVASDSRINIVVPHGGQSGAVGVTAPRGTTFSPTIFYLRPEISEIVPTSGPVGGSVTINGAHFDGITAITIGGALVAHWGYVTGGDRSINAEVPVGAQTGPIVVSNAGGNATSQVFTVEPPGTRSGSRSAIGRDAFPQPMPSRPIAAASAGTDGTLDARAAVVVVPASAALPRN